MSEGIRLRHPVLRSGMVRIATPRRYPVPFACNYCAKMGLDALHTFKTYHLLLDSEGYTYVSTTVLERLRTVQDMAGFVVANTVANPPTQTVGMAFGSDRVHTFRPLAPLLDGREQDDTPIADYRLEE